MGFLDRITGAQNLRTPSSSGRVQKESRVWPDIFLPYWQERGAPRDAQEPELRDFVETYNVDVWVRRCVEILADSISQVPLRVKRLKGDKLLPPDHPAAKVTRKPNPFQSWPEFVADWMTFIGLTGDSYVELVPDPQQRAFEDERGKRLPSGPAELYNLRPDRVMIVPDARTFIAGYFYFVEHKGSADPITFNADDVWHMRYPNPQNDYYGASPLRAATRPVVTDIEQDKYSTSFFKNSAIPNWILETDKQLRKQDTERLRSQIESGHQREPGWHRLLIVDDGMKAKQLGLGQQDMEFTKQRRWTMGQIAGAFGIPLPYLSTDELGDTNFREITLMFWNITLIPRLLKIEAALNCFVMPRFGPDVRAEFDLADIRALKADEAEKAQMGEILIRSGQMSQNEVRRRLWSMPDTPDGDIVYLPLSIAPAAGRGMESEAAEGAGADPEDAPDDDEPDDEDQDDEGQDDTRDDDEAEAGRANDDRQRERKSGKVPAPASDRGARVKGLDDGALWKFLDARLQEQERRVEQVVFRMLATQAQSVSQRIRQLVQKGVGDQVEAVLFNVEEDVAVFAPRMTQVLTDTYSIVQGEVFADLGVGVEIDTTPGPEELERLRKVAAADVRRISETTRGALRDSLLEGFGNGEDRDALLGRVSSVIGDMGPRVALIAQQEAGTAMSVATNDGFQRAGIAKSRWLTQRDARVSDGSNSPRNHRRLHGEVRKVGERFSNGLLYPREPSSSADEAVGCRCFQAPVLTGDRGDLPSGGGTVTPTPAEPLPPDQPLRPQRPEREGERAERLTWEQFGGSLPRDEARRELLEDALNRLNVMDPAARAKFVDALEKIPDFKFRVATKSTKSLSVMGRMNATKRRGYPPDLKRLDLQLMRENLEWGDWVTEHNAEFRSLRELVKAGDIDEQDFNNAMKFWKRTHPEPAKWRLASVDELEEVLVHELGHALDMDAAVGDQTFGLAQRFRDDGMLGEWQKAYWNGDVTEVSPGVFKPNRGATREGAFAYGTTKPEEAVAEAFRMYFTGNIDSVGYDGVISATRMTAEEWRERYPQLAQWIENVLGVN